MRGPAGLFSTEPGRRGSSARRGRRGLSPLGSHPGRTGSTVRAGFANEQSAPRDEDAAAGSYADPYTWAESEHVLPLASRVVEERLATLALDAHQPHFMAPGVDRKPMSGEPATFGDTLTVVSPLFDKSQTRRMGTAYGECVVAGRRLLEGTPYDCTYVLKLKRGTITTQGLDPHGVSDVFFAVTGGTGAYAEASGQAEYIDSSVNEIIIRLND